MYHAQVRLDAETARQVKATADREGVSLTEWLRTAIAARLEATPQAEPRRKFFVK